MMQRVSSTNFGIVANAVSGIPAGGAVHAVFSVFTMYKNRLPVQTMLSMFIPVRANTVTFICGFRASDAPAAKSPTNTTPMKSNRFIAQPNYTPARKPRSRSS